MSSSYTALKYHLVFSTKQRRPQIMPEFRDRMYSYIGGIIADTRGALLAAGGMPDHVHLLASVYPTIAIADLLRLIKTNSSKWIHETFPESGSFAWQEGYGAFTVSVSNLDRVRRYIANQEAHHRRRTFEEEFVLLLKRHGIEYDERYLWA